MVSTSSITFDNVKVEHMNKKVSQVSAIELNLMTRDNEIFTCSYANGKEPAKQVKSRYL